VIDFSVCDFAGQTEHTLSVLEARPYLRGENYIQMVDSFIHKCSFSHYIGFLGSLLSSVTKYKELMLLLHVINFTIQCANMSAQKSVFLTANTKQQLPTTMVKSARVCQPCYLLISQNHVLYFPMLNSVPVLLDHTIYIVLC
jgi:hypothetical protein